MKVICNILFEADIDERGLYEPDKESIKEHIMEVFYNGMTAYRSAIQIKDCEISMLGCKEEDENS